MQSDAKSAFYKKNHPNDRPGLHFGGLWGHFGALWAPNGTPEAVFLHDTFWVMFLGLHKVTREIQEL